MDESHNHYVKWKKPDAKDHLVHFCIYVKLEKRQSYNNRKQINCCLVPLMSTGGWLQNAPRDYREDGNVLSWLCLSYMNVKRIILFHHTLHQAIVITCLIFSLVENLKQCSSEIFPEIPEKYKLQRENQTNASCFMEE